MTQDIKKLDRTSAHGDYVVTTRRELIEAHIDDAGIRVRWAQVAPGRRPLPFGAFEEWNQVFDANFEVGQWSGVQWHQSPVPYTPTSKVVSIEFVTPDES